MPAKTAVVLGCMHMPFHDEKATQAVLEFIGWLKPETLIANGDIIDCYGMNSKYDRSPLRPDTLDGEIKCAREFLGHRAVQAVAEKYYLDGNHEERLSRLLFANADLFRRLGKESAKKAEQMMTSRALLGLDSLGFKWKEYGEWVRLGKLLVTHGDIVRAHSAYSAKGHFDRYGTNVLHNHTHRLGSYYRTTLGETKGAWENGCLCSLKAEWIKNPDWQQGFSVVQIAPSGRFHLQQIPIFSGEFYFGSKRFSA